MPDLSAHALLVTGGSRGIGAAIVREAAHAGARVCFSYQSRRDAAEALCAELRAQGHVVHAVQAEAGEADFASRLYGAATSLVGPPTLLVNNAGITGRYGSFHDLPADVLRRTFDVNVVAPMELAQETVRHWRKAGIAGRMVNISSIAATLGAPHEYVHYAASKAAIDAFTIGLAKELGATGIRVNAVAPGTTLTDIHAAIGVPERPARVAAQVPMRRVAEPPEIARAVVWLLSDEASYVTGAILRVSGGT
ncbi:MAG: SDR family oxidoreductase [Pseudomonadota bacterium]|jgi:NAD(P)-dependent dehydrogenase (short-subunit alcohol dehydrogenase family)|nr:MAG: oxidoreductase [Pseudomonadota bacterium]